MPAFLSFCFFLSFFLYILFSAFSGCSHVRTSLFSVNGHDSSVHLLLFLSLCISFFFSLGFLLPTVAQSLKPRTTAWQLCVKGFVNPQGSDSAAQQWKVEGVLLMSGTILTFCKPCRAWGPLLLPTLEKPALGGRFGSSFSKSPETPRGGESEH